MSSPPSAGSSSSSNSDAEMEEIKSSESESEQKAEQTSKKQELIKYQSLSNLSCEPAAVTASGIRTLSSKYERLLSQATEEIQRLSEEKARLEAAHTKLLGSNVAMAEELRALYLQQREWRDTEKEMLIANEEFATEVENLYTKEEKLMDELEKLQSANKSLEDERAQQKVVVKKMFSENLKNVAQLEMFKKQQRMDEALKLENEQLKLENEFLTTSQKNTSDRMHTMEKETEQIKNDLKDEREKVRNLSAWRDQLSEKNCILSTENEMLKVKSDNLEQLVNTEVGDIDNILHTINSLQGTQL